MLRVVPMSSDPLRVQAVFLAIVEQPAEERAAILDRECNGDNELRHRVEALLKAHDEPGSLIDALPHGVDMTETRRLLRWLCLIFVAYRCGAQPSREPQR